MTDSQTKLVEEIASMLGDVADTAKTFFEWFAAYKIAGFTEQQSLYLVGQMVRQVIGGQQQEQAT